MGSVIAIGPGGRAQAPLRDDRCRPVIEFVVSAGLLDQLLVSPACKTLHQAEELGRAIYRSARYYCSCDRTSCTRKHPNYPTGQNPDGGCPHGGQRISCRADVVTLTDPGSGSGRKQWAVEFRLYDKSESMRHVIAKHGPDPNSWPYFARRKQLKEKNNA